MAEKHYTATDKNIKRCNTSQATSKNRVTDCEEILSELKVIMSDFYIALLTKEDNALQLKFNNGQKFIVSVKEI